MQDHSRLQVWRRAQELLAAIGAATERMPSGDAGSLRNQLRRQSASIVTVIAEGAAASSRVQFARYLQIAITTTAELESLLGQALRLRHVAPATLTPITTDLIILRRMLIALRRRVMESLNAAPSRSN